MAEVHQSTTRLIRRMHLRIMLLVAGGILLTSLLTGLSAVLPYYHDTRTNLKEITQITAIAQADALHHRLTRYQDIARQFVSRSEIRRQLEAFHRGELSLEALQTYTTPRLAEAMQQVPDVIGLVRQHISGSEISRLGQAPEKPVPGKSHAPGYPCKFLQLDDGSLLVQACAPIFNEAGEQIGRDLVFFNGAPLLDLLQLDPRWGSASTAWLTDTLGHQIMASQALGGSLDTAVEQISADTALSQLVAPLGDSNWQLHIAIPEQQLEQQSLHLLLWPSATIIVLALGGTLLVNYLIHPVLRSARRQAQALEKSEQQQRQAASVFRHASEAILITNPHNAIVEVNPAFCSLTGYQAASLIGKPLPELLVKRATLPEDIRKVLQQLNTEDAWQGEVHYRCADDSELIALQTISAVRDADGSLIRYIHIFNDITAKKREEEAVRHSALHDELTGLPNRAMLEQQLRLRLSRRRGNDSEHFALLFLDLDRFKQVNDTLGHQAGDQLLQAVTQRLTDTLRSEDLLARLGGDEFILLLDPIQAAENAETVAANVLEALSTPFQLGSDSAQIGVSIGIALYPQDGLEGETLLKAADAAMYAAKGAGRNTWRFAASVNPSAPS